MAGGGRGEKETGMETGDKIRHLEKGSKEGGWETD